MKKYAIRNKKDLRLEEYDYLYIHIDQTFDTLEELYDYFKWNHYIPYKQVTLGYQKEREYISIQDFLRLYENESTAKRMHTIHQKELNEKYDSLLTEYLTWFEIIEVTSVGIFDENKFI